jgi:hypothetical protein
MGRGQDEGQTAAVKSQAHVIRHSRVVDGAENEVVTGELESSDCKGCRMHRAGREESHSFVSAETGGSCTVMRMRSLDVSAEGKLYSI